jgi:hypothetical protein
MSAKPAPALPKHLVLGIALAVLIVFGKTAVFGFVDYDDPDYVVENAYVHKGLSLQGVHWAYTTFAAANYHPLTWLSLQLDYECYGLWAGGYHLSNLVLHLANAVLLACTLHRLSGAVYRCALVAALFALHPLHVESVAWVAERKDVLSTFFGLLTVWFYGGYAVHPAWWRYLPVFLSLLCSLLAKPMLVTMPFVLLLLDYWPLRRFGRNGSVLAEKLPLLVLAAACCFMTIWAQGSGGAIGSLEAFPLTTRLGNAILSYLAYLGQTFWPFRLGLAYPFPPVPWSSTWTWLGALVLMTLSLRFLLQARSRPYLTVGWFWYLGTLVPVIGIVQVGTQAHADRYTYFPLIGIFWLLVWGVTDLVQRWSAARKLFAVMAGVFLCLCAIGSWRQLDYWRNNRTLWEHSLGVTGPTEDACTHLASYYLQHGDWTAALTYAEQALGVSPKSERAHRLLGKVYYVQRRYDEAITEFRSAARLNPEWASAQDSAIVNDPSETLLARLSEALMADSIPFQPRPSEDKLQLASEMLFIKKAQAAKAEALANQP